MKYCTDCGRSLDNGQKFCDECGSPVYAEAVQPPVKQPAAKKSRKLAAWLGAGGGVLIVAAVAAVWIFNLFLEKNPRELYLYAEWKTAQEQAGGPGPAWAAATELWRKWRAEPSRTEIGLAAQISGSVEEEGFFATQALLKNSAITLRMERNPSAREEHDAITYFFGNDSLFEASFTRNAQDEVAIRAPALYDKTLYVDNSGFGDLMRAFDFYYTGPETLFGEKSSPMSEEQRRRAQQRFAELLLNNLADEQFTLTKNVPYTTPDGVVKLRKISIRMDEEETKRLLTAMLGQLRRDNELLEFAADWLGERMVADNQIVWLLSGSRLSAVEWLKDGLYRLNSELLQTSFPDGFQADIYIDSHERVVERKIGFAAVRQFNGGDFASRDELNLTLHTTQRFGKMNRSGTIELEAGFSPGDRVALSIETNRPTDRNKDRQSEYKANFAYFQGGEARPQIDADLELLVGYADQGKDGTLATDYDFDVRLRGQQFAGEGPAITGKIKHTAKQNLPENQASHDLNVAVTYREFETLAFALDLSSDFTFGDAVRVPNIEADAVDLIARSEAELDEIWDDIYWSVDELWWDLSERLDTGLQADTAYGVPEDELFPATRAQLNDPNYSNLILPDELDRKLADEGNFFVYYYASDCPHCQRTTPQLKSLADEMGVNLHQFNLREFSNYFNKMGIESTPTVVYYKGGAETARMAGGLQEEGTTIGYTLDDYRTFFNKHLREGNE